MLRFAPEKKFGHLVISCDVSGLLAPHAKKKQRDLN